MKTLLNLLTLILIYTSCVSCDNISFSSNTNFYHTSSEKRNIDIEFDKISVMSGIELIIESANETSIKVDADHNIQKNLITEVKNGELKIYFNKNIKNIKTRKVYLKTPKIINLKASENSKINSLHNIKSKKLNIQTFQGGTVNLNIDCNELYVESTSGSKIILKGNAKNTLANASSGGVINCEKLYSTNCSATAFTGAKIEINCANEIIASAKTGALIKYYGNPTTKNTSSNTGGRIEKD